MAAFLARSAIPIAVVLLAIWAGLTFSTAVPGWVHALLTTGVFLLVFGVVQRGTTHRP